MRYLFVPIDEDSFLPVHHALELLTDKEEVTAKFLMDYIHSKPKHMTNFTGFWVPVHVMESSQLGIDATRKGLRQIKTLCDWPDFIINKCFVLCDSERVLNGKTDLGNLVHLFVTCARIEPKDGGETHIVTHTATHARKKAQNAAKNANLLTIQDVRRPDAIWNGRPHTLTGPPIGVYHPIFPLFRQRLLEKCDLSPRDIRTASLLCQRSSLYYPDEKARQGTINFAFRHFLGVTALTTIELVIGGKLVKSDGSRQAGCGIYSTDDQGFYVLYDYLAKLEQTNRACNPQDECEREYALMSTQSELQALRDISCIPAFLLSISGVKLSISGAIFLDGVVSELLTDPISFVPISTYHAHAAHSSPLNLRACRIAHTLAALRECLIELDRYYHELRPSTPPPGQLSPGPCFSSFTSKSGQEFKLTYVE
ncbi:hypothetical protein BDP27DRAFT_1428208 [Rhodocollybia butyracea]|uniref:Uncharacterized protein n=1 Tax=Rhodocollybia butyracea TaxID=206335 RepID=A0A9P5PFC7_9AGAR|nr:hypothetical protein BDP27DRAFT_1428208 [Rhodocollybia butyracea]